jgi:hypothetical protein
MLGRVEYSTSEVAKEEQQEHAEKKKTSSELGSFN